MDTTCLISVVLPLYNGELYLYDAIESVLAQTYSRWELVIVDDGSVDRSLEIACCYANCHPDKIFIYQHSNARNCGTAASRHLGIVKSRGEFVANLDQDDCFVPEKLELQLGILEAYPDAGFTFAPMLFGSSPMALHALNNQDIQLFSFSLPRTFRKRELIPKLLAFKDDPHGYLARRSVLLESQCYSDKVGICEDTAAYVRMNYQWPAYVSQKPLYFYRQNPSSHTGRLRSPGSLYRAHFPFFLWVYWFLFSRSCCDTLIWFTLVRTTTRYYWLGYVWCYLFKLHRKVP